MTNKSKLNPVIALTAIGMLLAMKLLNADDQPTSTITVDGDAYVPYLGETPLTLSTSEVPTPNCPDDTPDGDPTYYWDFGPDLDGSDNMDGTFYGTPDTATIATDVAGTYPVSVYCTENFTPSSGSNSDDYSNSTKVDQTPDDSPDE